jgi:hypothetical protein
MECIEFKRAAGAEPQCLSVAAREHMSECVLCERYAQQMLSLDGLLQRALQLPVTSHVPLPPLLHVRNTSRWWAVAASLLLTAAIASGAWLALPRTTLASELIEHVSAEQDIVTGAQPLSISELNKVLVGSGMRINSSPQHPVWYAKNCPFRGHEVPHLIVQTAQGRVTVLLLTSERVRKVQTFDEQGYRGTILPSGPGSIAIIATNRAAIEEAAKHVAAAVEWVKK